MDWMDSAGYLASALVVATFCMKTMASLRAVAICSNIAFIVYALCQALHPILMLHSILLPLNIFRFAQMLRVKECIKATQSSSSTEGLNPFMSEKQWKAGEIIFHQGDLADCLYLVVAGEVYLAEIDQHLRHGDLFGEVELLSPDRLRTETARAVTNVELLRISESELALVCRENPATFLHLLKLINNRLLSTASGVPQIATTALHC